MNGYFWERIFPLLVSFILGYLAFVLQQNYSMKQKLKLKDAEVEMAREEERKRIDEDQTSKIDRLAAGLVALMRTELVREHDHAMKQQFMSAQAKESMQRMYTVYRSLGGNDIGTKMHQDMISLKESPEYGKSELQA